MPKKRLIGIACLGIAITLSLYIGYCTNTVEKNIYRSIAWNYIEHNSSILDWENSAVELVGLSPKKFIFQGSINGSFYFSSRVNRLLLRLNGNHAVKVTFKTRLDSLLGPEVIYVNPFTKSVIGVEIRY